MELVLVKGEACVKKHVENEKVYRTLAASKIAGVPEILKIETNEIYYKYVNGETLTSRLKNDKNISTEFIKFLIFSCANIACELRNYNIVHNDITPDNIIITPRGKIFLIDFENATFEGKSCDFKIEETSYSSPEVLSNHITTYQSDIYSLGKVLEHIDSGKVFEKIVNKCIASDPKDRYTSFKALLHEFNAIYVMSKEDDISFRWTDYFNKNVLLASVLIFLVGGGMGYYFSSFAQASNTFKYIVFSIYATFVVVDACDYIRVVMFEGNRLRKILSFKLIFSAIVFFATVLIALILM